MGMGFTCCCSGGTVCGVIGVTVKGCFGVVRPGASVTVSLGGTTVGTCTTDGAGKCSVSVTATGVYTVTVSLADYATFTTTVNVSSCVGSAFPVAANLTPATGYSCINPCCDDPGLNGAGQDVSWPTTAFLNDGIGTITMTGGGASASWSGTATRAASGPSTCTPPLNPLSCLGTPASNNVTLYFSMQCSGFNAGTRKWSFIVAVGYYPCRTTSACSNVCSATSNLSVDSDLSCGWAFGTGGLSEGPRAPGASTDSVGFSSGFDVATNTCNPYVLSGSGTVSASAATSLSQVYGTTCSFGTVCCFPATLSF